MTVPDDEIVWSGADVGLTAADQAVCLRHPDRDEPPQMLIVGHCSCGARYFRCVLCERMVPDVEIYRAAFKSGGWTPPNRSVRALGRRRIKIAGK